MAHLCSAKMSRGCLPPHRPYPARIAHSNVLMAAVYGPVARSLAFLHACMNNYVGTSRPHEQLCWNHRAHISTYLPSHPHNHTLIHRYTCTPHTHTHTHIHPYTYTDTPTHPYAHTPIHPTHTHYPLPPHTIYIYTQYTHTRNYHTRRNAALN